MCGCRFVIVLVLDRDLKLASPWGLIGFCGEHMPSKVLYCDGHREKREREVGMGWRENGTKTARH